MQKLILIREALWSASIVIKTSILLVIAFYFISLVPGAYSFFAVSPRYLLPPAFKIWTLLTGIVTEATIINVIVDIPMLVLCGTYIEPVWGAFELLKFTLITGIGSIVSTSFFSVLLYAFTSKHDFVFIEFSGLISVIGGISVAMKQLCPDVKLNAGFSTIQTQYAPLLFLLLTAILSVLNVVSHTQIILQISGINIGWIYLRFYQPRGKGLRGDMSDTFSASSFFPMVLRPSIDAISNICFRIFVLVGLCKYPTRTYDMGSPSTMTISLPGTDPTDAERRRKKALRALNERLIEMKSKEESEDLVRDDPVWPAIDTDSSPVKSVTDTREESKVSSNPQPSGEMKIDIGQ